jgi:hypothetical protein
VLAGQVLYCLSLSPALSALVIYQVGSHIYLHRPDHNPLIYISLRSREDICVPPGSAFSFFFFNWFEIGSANFLPGLASNHDPPDLCLLSSEDYRCEPPCPAVLLGF